MHNFMFFFSRSLSLFFFFLMSLLHLQPPGSTTILHFTYSEEMDTLPINEHNLGCTQAFRCADGETSETTVHLIP